MQRRIRQYGARRYRRIIVISTEGSTTEPHYFRMFSGARYKQQVKVLATTASDPGNVLKRMQRHLGISNLQPTDQAWLVIDKDEWQDTQIQPLHKWSKTDDRYGLALSNPKFEYWLLLHFEDADGIKSSKDCAQKLQHHVPNYDKKIEPQKFRPHVRTAIERARGHPTCKDWPRTTGTTVYRLVEELMRSDSNIIKK